MPFKKAGGKMSLEFEPSSPENKTCNWSTNTVLQFDWSGYHPISNEFLIMTTSSTFRNRVSCFAVILYDILNFYGSFHTATDSQPTSYSQLNSAHIYNRHGLLQELVFFHFVPLKKKLGVLGVKDLPVKRHPLSLWSWTWLNSHRVNTSSLPCLSESYWKPISK